MVGKIVYQLDNLLKLIKGIWYAFGLDDLMEMNLKVY